MARQAAFVVTMTDADADEYRSRIWLVATDGTGTGAPADERREGRYRAALVARWAATGLPLDARRQAAAVCHRPRRGRGAAIDHARRWGGRGGVVARWAATRVRGDGPGGKGPLRRRKRRRSRASRCGSSACATSSTGAASSTARRRSRSRRHLFVLDLPADADAPARRGAATDRAATGTMISRPGRRIASGSPSSPIASRMPTARCGTISGQWRSTGSAAAQADRQRRLRPPAQRGRPMARRSPTSPPSRPSAPSPRHRLCDDRRRAARAGRTLSRPTSTATPTAAPISDQTLPGGTARPIWTADGARTPLPRRRRRQSIALPRPGAGGDAERGASTASARSSR